MSLLKDRTCGLRGLLQKHKKLLKEAARQHANPSGPKEEREEGEASSSDSDEGSSSEEDGGSGKESEQE